MGSISGLVRLSDLDRAAGGFAAVGTAEAVQEQGAQGHAQSVAAEKGACLGILLAGPRPKRRHPAERTARATCTDSLEQSHDQGRGGKGKASQGKQPIIGQKCRQQKADGHQRQEKGQKPR